MFDTNYYMEKLRKGEFVAITFNGRTTTVLRRGIFGYVGTVVSLDCGNTVLLSRWSKREVLDMIDRAVAYDAKINTYKRHYVG